MDFENFTAEKNDDGRRIDKLIRVFIPSMPLSLVYKNIRTGFIRLNEKKIKQDAKVFYGDVIGIEKHLYEKFRSISSSEKVAEENDEKKNGDTGFYQNLIKNITIFKNDDILILNKPYNMNVQESQNDKNSLDKIVKSVFEGNSLSFKPGPMHRLDKLTTGIVCFSQSLEGARWFSEEIAHQKIEKYYLALVEGKVLSAEKWEDNLIKGSSKEKGFYKSSVVKDDKSEFNEGKDAITFIKPLSYGNLNGRDISLVELYIPTGRNHQIRLQCSHHGHPVLGDSVYDSSVTKLEQKLYLHCYRLKFKENDFEIPLEIKAPLPSAFKELMKKCLIEWY